MLRPLRTSPAVIAFNDRRSTFGSRLVGPNPTSSTAASC